MFKLVGSLFFIHLLLYNLCVLWPSTLLFFLILIFSGPHIMRLEFTRWNFYFAIPMKFLSQGFLKKLSISVVWTLFRTYITLSKYPYIRKFLVQHNVSLPICFRLAINAPFFKIKLLLCLCEYKTLCGCNNIRKWLHIISAAVR